MARLDGVSLGIGAAGALLMYAGIKGDSIPALLQAFIQGKSPASVPATVTDTTAGLPAGSQAPSSSIASSPSSGYYSASQLQQLWISNGGPSDTAAFAAQVAQAESSGDPKATSPNPDGGTNVGLWQLDTEGVGAGYSVSELENAGLNASVTILATGGGRNWQEWADPVVDNLPGGQYTPGG